MPIVGIAEVLVQPVFTGVQRKISKEVTPAAEKAGRSAGTKMGAALADGFDAEAAGLEAEVARLGKAVSQAETAVSASKTKMADASAAESKALGELRVAELKLQEVRDNSRAKASQIAAAEEKLNVVRDRATAATNKREAAEAALTTATTNLGTAQQNSSKASADLETHMKRVGDESANTERQMGRLSTMLNNAFRGSPLARMVTSMRNDTDRVRLDLHQLAGDVSREGTRGGRDFTQAFVGVVGGLSAITPAVGAAGAALLAGSGNAITFAASLSSLAGVAALLPAGLMAVGAGAGVLATAFAGVGEALKTSLDASKAVSTMNPRLAAMAVEDAMMAITVAEENAAEAQENAARRVADAKRGLQEVTLAAAEAQKAAARAVEMAERNEAEAARDVIKAQKELVTAREEAAKRVQEVGQKLATADRKAVDTALAYKRAVEVYNKAKLDKKSGADELAQLENNVAKALAADEAAKQSVLDLRAEHKSAQAEAKAGNEKVLAAEQKLTDARQAQADAVQARKDAQADAVKAEQEGAQRIKDAQQAITDATRQAEKAQTDAARAVQQAHRNLERVQLQQADSASQAGKKSAEAMGNLTPAAQEAVRSLLAVKDQLGGIRRIAQENFFTGFSASLLSLAGSVMPQLATGVGAIASALGSGAQIFMGAVQSALGNGVLESLLMGVAKTTSILNTAITPVVEAFTTLGVVGMDYMPRLAGFIADIADRFNGFIQTAAADGSLVAWIDGGIQALKDLWSVGSSIVGIFGSLNQAAEAGGAVSTLGGLAAALRDIDAAMQGEVFQTTMATLFAGAQAGADGLKQALGPIADAFVRGAPAMAEFLRLGGEIAGTFLGGVFTALSNPEFGSGLVSFLQGLQRGAEAAAPLLSGLTGAFGRLLDAAGPIVAQLGPSLIEVFTFFGDSIAGLLTVLQPMLVALADSPVVLGLLIGAFTATAAASAALTAAGNVQRIAMAAWAAGTKIVAAAQWLWNNSIKAFPGMWIIGLIGAVVAGLVWFFTQTELGQQIVQNVWAAIQVAVQAVVTWFQTVAMPVIQQVFAVIGAVFTWLYANIVQPVWNGIVTVVNAAWLVIRGIFQLVTSVIQNVIGPVFNWLWKSVIQPVFGFIGSLIHFWWNTRVKPIFDAVNWLLKNVLGPAFDWLYKNAIKPAWDSIASIIKTVWEKNVKPIFDALHKFINETIPNAFKTGVGFIRDHWQKLQDIAKKPVKFVVEQVINKGLIGAFNTIADILPGIDRLPDVKLPQGFTRGGILPGQSSWRNGDDQLVPMRRGEGVYVSEVMRDPYERARLYTMNRAAIAGRPASEARALLGEGFARGGIVNPLRNMQQTQGYNRIHKGIDLAAAVGTPVFATENGRVSWSGEGVRGPGVWGGNEIHIDGGSGIQSWFAHLSQMFVRVGQMVRAGQQIGKSGNTGISSGPHLHFGTFAGGWPNDINPYSYLSGAAQPSGKDGGGFDPLGLITGLAGKIANQVKSAFPAAGFVVDAVVGVGKKLIGSVADWVKGKLGFGSATGSATRSMSAAHEDPALYDLGGILPPGLSQVVNRTRQPEYILNPRQWDDMHHLATRSAAAGAGQTNHFTLNEVGDPTGTSMAIARRLKSLKV
ncbi:tape measure protein [Arthrobacter phage Elesar]|uniref:Tape measure protein n=1 Tax=Arthrobacter phage Elesar TaxID=2510522 RepID=A0A411CQ74_9CAUD|nr:tape measure protein [Arthrobacter phage Elesar]QAY16071.1 tape measure protein [Arthrobacter phage Elesar]